MLISRYIDVEHQIIGHEEHIASPAPLYEANKINFSFCDHPKASQFSRKPLDIIDKIYGEVISTDMQMAVLSRVTNSNAGVIICPKGDFYEEITGKAFILVDNPRYVFTELVNSLFVDRTRGYIHPTVCIGEYSMVGANTVIYGHVYIYPNVTIGNNVTIHAGAVIGADGFGFSRRYDGKLEKFPQIGGVIIGDNVEIGANTCIDRGSLGNTFIGEGTKIDNLVHIGHNAKIGTNCVIVAQSMIGGSVIIGANSWVAPAASIMNQVKVGMGSVIGMGAVVVKDVPITTTVKGVPAK